MNDEELFKIYEAAGLAYIDRAVHETPELTDEEILKGANLAGARALYEAGYNTGYGVASVSS